MDLNTIADVSTSDYTVIDPTTGAPTDLVITLAGPEHEKRKQLDLSRARKVRRELAKSGKLQMVDPEDEIEDQTDLMVVCTLGWKGLEDKGVPVPFSPEKARELYGDPKLAWLRKQVLNALFERDRFIASSATA